MAAIRFTARIRYWDPERGRGLAVVEIPPESVQAMGGLKQQRVGGRIGGIPFTSNVMAAGGGHLTMSVTKAMMSSAHVGIGDEAEFEVTPPTET